MRSPHPTRARRATLALAVVAVALTGGFGGGLGGGRARAHGTIPTSNSVSFGPGAGGVLLGSNFGGLVVAGDDLRFLCERGVTGEQTSVDVWQWLAGGAVAAIVTTGGFIRGAWLSEPGGCAFGVVAGSEDLLMTDLAPDPRDPSGFYAVGATTGAGAEARLVRRAAGGAVEVLASAPAAAATTVRAAGDDVYTVFLGPGEATLVHRSGATETRWTTPRSGNESLRPLGVDPAAPATVWLVRRTETADVLLRSEDGGEHTTEVLTVDARLGGFAIDGERVWVQSARLGVHASQDRGKTFALVDGSPHGTCLGVGPDGRLYACGVPWQDGMALGATADGARFEPVVARYDDIAGALVCADHAATTALCEDELDFLRGYYGFAGATGGGEDGGAEGVEPGPEPTAEPGPEVAAEDAAPGDAGGDGGAAEASARAADDGCAGGRDDLAVGVLWTALFAAARTAFTGGHRRVRPVRAASARPTTVEVPR